MIKPHGGKLINRVLNKRDGSVLLRNKSIPRIVVDEDILIDIENIAEGVYSPLEGFMTKKEFDGVVVNKRLPGGLAWTIPIIFASNKKDLEGVSRGSTILLSNSNGEVIGSMKVKDMYSVNKKKAAKHVFGTNNRKHPGVNKFYSMGDVFLGGKVWLIKRNKGLFDDFNLTPREVRKVINKKGWKTIAGFQTRNIPHRAHEYLQKCALSLVDGVFIHPIVGWKKKGDFKPEVIIKAYNILLKYYYPEDRHLLSGFTTAMRYAGPNEAVFHAIIRKNFGCTHFIVGRDHAGVGGFYDLYAAHRIFKNFPDLDIQPLLLRGPYYCKKCSSIVNDKVCPHIGTKHEVAVSATKIRKMVSAKKDVGREYLRKEVSDFICNKGHDCFI